MNAKFTGVAVCSLLILCTWFFLSDPESSDNTIHDTQAQSVTPMPDHDAWKFEKVMQSNAGNAPTSPQERLFTEAVQLQMADISEAFAENMRYPSYSKPLSNTNWTLLHPRAFIPKSTPIAGQHDTTVEIVIPRFIVTRDESFPVTVNVLATGANSPQVQELSLRLGKDQHALTLQSSSSTAGKHTFNAFIRSELLQEIEEKDVILSADITFDNLKQAKVNRIFKLVGNQAVLESLSTSYVDDTDLVIPANFSVETEGYYRVQANLFDKNTKEPISHLNSAFTLESGRSSGLLKVHAETLRNKGFSGPYILKDFNITLSPAAPGEQTGYGSSKHASYDVQGFDLDSYSREAYQDQHSEQRLQFLQKMAGIEAK